jgi:protein KTI12
MTRHIARDTILIVDSMNYIKEFRYRMYCKTREAGVGVSTVGNEFQYSHWRAAPTDTIEN